MKVREPEPHPQHTPVAYPELRLTKSIAPVIKPTYRWPEKFKISAVRLSRILGTKKTAAVFGVREPLISTWRSQYNGEV